MEMNFHPYHMVTMSPWPLLVGLGSMYILLGLVKLMVFSEMDMMVVAFLVMFVLVFLWWRDVVRESSFQGMHLFKVVKGLEVGMILFILSEVLFFFSFFWTYFHSSLNPCLEMGGVWPPEGLNTFNPFQVPLLNTIILLSSGVTITLAHQNLLMSKMEGMYFSLMLTWLLGLYFLSLQVLEYYMMEFSMSDCVFGSVFFVATGFHGLHVMIGSVFLIIIFFRLKKIHFSSDHHFGFEAAAWYWHFVDVVWLFLFSVVYWWGGW
uniref:Cytochrome c oxidase subunit 3 n=1 Tax=Atypus karschi TaxID=2337319 RepID=A0A8A5Y6P6_9ARAC|nr:cytochrome c oxidase subunit III [Atypus karschi]QTH31099.1 cytochrome c oxidase subunit 3 [Atypus karschi]